MKKMLIGITLLITTNAIATFNFEGKGSYSEQTLNGEQVASGSNCEVVVNENVVSIIHDAKIDGWDIGVREVSLDLSTARFTNGVYKKYIGKIKQGHCGDFQSARNLERYIKQDGKKVIYGESYRCSFEIFKTVNEHICHLD